MEADSMGDIETLKRSEAFRLPPTTDVTKLPPLRRVKRPKSIVPPAPVQSASEIRKTG